jgi:hypothetical protein
MKPIEARIAALRLLIYLWIMKLTGRGNFVAGIYIDPPAITKDAGDGTISTLSMTWDQWVREYMPHLNKATPAALFERYMFETSGDDFHQVMKYPPERIWTMIDEDSAARIENGLHSTKSLGYFITRKACPQNVKCWVKTDEPDEENGRVSDIGNR